MVWLAIALPSLAQDAGSGSGGEASKQVFHKVCGSCHPAEAVTAGRKTQAQWEETFIKMIQEQGAKATEEEFNTAFDYLLANYGRVDVNRAPILEITAVLGLTDKDAKAILDYRRANGHFKDFDSLLKVPDVDVEKLKRGREAISF